MNKRIPHQRALNQVTRYLITIILLAFSNFLQGQIFTADLGAMIRGAQIIQSITPVFNEENYPNDMDLILSVISPRKEWAFFFLIRKFFRNDEFSWKKEENLSEVHLGSLLFTVPVNQADTSGRIQAVQQKSEAEMFFPRLTEVWSAKSQGKVAGLAVVKEKVLWTTDEGQIFMAEARTGNLQKSLKLDTEMSWQLASGEKGFWLSSERKLYYINSQGQVELNLTLPEILGRPPLNDNGTLLLVFKNRLEARDSDSGNSLWKYDLPTEASSSIISTPSYVFMPINSGAVIKLDRKTGQKLSQYEFKMDITSIAVSDERKLFVGSKSGRVQCYDLEKDKLSWQMDLGSLRIEYLLAHGKSVYVLTSSGLLYTLKQSGGDITWWQIVPGRTFFNPVLFQNEIIIPVLGKTIYGLNTRTGKKSSETKLSFEIKTNPLVVDDFLFIGTYDYSQDYSLVYALKKEPQIFIRPSRESPQPAGQQITFTVLVAGFENPKYEFYLQSPDGQEKLVRKASKLNTWTWFPLEPGDYTIIARVFDKKLSEKIEFRYNIISFNM